MPLRVLLLVQGVRWPLEQGGDGGMDRLRGGGQGEVAFGGTNLANLFTATSIAMVPAAAVRPTSGRLGGG